MATTTWLKLRLSSDLTADSIYNLNRIDALGSVYGLTATGNIVVRASGNLSLEPNSSAVGGSGTGGDLNLGTSGHDLDAINAYGPLKLRTNAWLMARGVLRAYETDSTNYIGLRAPDTVAADLTFSLPGTDGAAGQVLVTDGAGAWGWSTQAITAALAQYEVDVGSAAGTRTPVDTNSVGDILADSTGGLTYKAGSIVNADVSGSAAIAYSKLNLTGAVLNADLAGSIAYSKLVLSGSVVNADIHATAAIAYSKLAALTASKVLISDGSGFVSASSITNTQLGYLSTTTSDVQSQLDAKLPLTGGTLQGDLTLAGDPDSSLKAATKQYVDSLVAGIKWKSVVRVATTAAGTLASDYESGDTIDGVVLAQGDRLLIKDQAAPAENGIYVVAASGAPARATDADAFAELNSACVMVSDGTANADKGFLQTATLTSLSDSQTWTQNFGTGLYAASGEGIELSGSTFSLELDGGSLSKSADGLRVATSGVDLASMVTGILGAANGGTGVANNAAATLTRSGDHALTLTTSATTNVTLPTTGTLSTLAGAEVITGKDHDGGTASNTSRLTVPKSDFVTLDGLTRKQGTLVYDTDNLSLLVDDGSTLQAVGSGAGSGEKNYITNPSAAIAITGWVASGADVTVARTTSESEQPREFTTGTAIKILGTAATEDTNDYVYYDFTLDDVDVSKKLKIQWSQKILGSYAAGTLAVVITTQADRTTALHTPVVTAIPAADGVFTTSFDSSTTTTLSLVIRATGEVATAGGIAISDVVVGPGIQPQGAVVSEWVSYTPTGAWSTNTTWTGRWRRVGQNMELDIKAATSGAPTTASFTALLPTGYTIDTASLTASINALSTVYGHAIVNDADTTAYNAHVLYHSTTGVRVLFQNNASGAMGSVTQAAPITFGAGDSVHLHCSIPIAEWAGSGTMNVIQDDTLTEWATYSPTLKGSSNGSTFTNQTTTGMYRRVGDTIEFEIRTSFSGAPGVGTGVFLWTLPTGLTIDTTKILSDRVNGNSVIYNATEDVDSSIVSQAAPCFVETSGFRMIYLEGGTTGDYLSATHPEAWQSGDFIKATGSFPVTEWRGRSGGGPVGFAMANATQAGLVSTTTQTIAGDKTVTGTTSHSGNLNVTGALRPLGAFKSDNTAISGSTNAAVITGVCARVVNGAVIGGITGGADGRIIYLTASGASFTLDHLNGGAAADQIDCGAGDLTVTAGCTLVYNDANSKWNVCGYI